MQIAYYRKVPYLIPPVCHFSKANNFVPKNFIAQIKAILNFTIYPLFELTLLSVSYLPVEKIFAL